MQLDLLTANDALCFAKIEPSRVYRRVNLSKDGPYVTKKAYPDLHG